MYLREYYEQRKRVIRAMLEQNIGITQIAKAFGVSRQNIWQTIRRYDLDRGLTTASKDADDYYINQRYPNVRAGDAEVRTLEELAKTYDVNLKDAS